MIAGGRSDRGTVLATTEILDPRKGYWVPGPRMFDARADFSWLRLRSGKILVTGGRGATADLAEAEIYDPVHKTWMRARPMRHKRSQHGIAMLPNGDALVCGGVSSGIALSGCEEFRYATETWYRSGQMTQARYAHTFVNLGDYGILAAGGRSSKASVLASAEVWTNESGWQPTSNLNEARGEHGSIVLSDGRVIVAGGAASENKVFPSHAEIFDPRSGLWSQAGAIKPRARPGVTLWNDRPVVVGGYLTTPIEPGLGYALTERVDHAEYLDLAQGHWLTLPGIVDGASALSATALQDGRLLVAGGESHGQHGDYTGLIQSDMVLTLESSFLRPSGTDTLVAPAPRAPRAKPRRKVRPDDLAVVVGVERYRSLPVASYAENDASSVEDALRDLGVPEENIVRLNGPRAGLSELSKYFEEWLPLHAKKTSRVFVFFSGHGAPDIASSVPFLMPWDGDATFVKSTGYPLSKLYESLGKLQAREVIVALDSCFTGVGDRSVLAPGLRPLATVRMPAVAPGRISVLSASSANEAAGSLPSARHGAFTHHLVRGLSGAADGDADGHLTLAELHAFIRKGVILDARTQHREQNPTLFSPDPGLKLY